jgi:hypothetical protein
VKIPRAICSDQNTHTCLLPVYLLFLLPVYKPVGKGGGGVGGVGSNWQGQDMRF